MDYSISHARQGFTAPGFSATRNVQSYAEPTQSTKTEQNVNWQQVGFITAGVAFLAVVAKMLHARSFNIFEDGVSNAMDALKGKVKTLEDQLSQTADEFKKTHVESSPQELDVFENEVNPTDFSILEDLNFENWNRWKLFKEKHTIKRGFIPAEFERKGVGYNPEKGIYQILRPNSKGKLKPTLIEPAAEKLRKAIYNTNSSQSYDLSAEIKAIRERFGVQIAQTKSGCYIITNPETGISTLIPSACVDELTHSQAMELARKGLFLLPKGTNWGLPNHWRKRFEVPKGGFPVALPKKGQLPGFLVPVED
jgi:hypothetical protein